MSSRRGSLAVDSSVRLVVTEEEVRPIVSTIRGFCARVRLDRQRDTKERMPLETLHTERMSKVQFGGRLERGKERTHLQRRVTVDFLRRRSVLDR